MNTSPPVHAREILLEDFMKSLGFSQYRLSKDIGVSALRISQIVRGQRAITADTVLRLVRYFGTSPNVWVRLQATYDLEMTQRQIGKRIAAAVSRTQCIIEKGLVV